MNALSATSVADATAAAAFAGALLVAMLPHPAALTAVSGPHFARIGPSAEALLPAAPMLDDCAPFAPAGPDVDARRSTLLLASNDAPTAPSTAAPDASDDRSSPNDGGCGPDGERHSGSGPDVGGLGSGWIISADGVMRMNPYSLSDTHSIAVRPAEPLREFKGRVLGLGHGGTMPHGAQPVPEGKERRPLLVVDNRVAPPAGQAGSAVAGAADERGRRGGFAAFAFAATAEASFPTRRARV